MFGQVRVYSTKFLDPLQVITYLVLVSGFELKKSTKVEYDWEEDESDDGDGARAGGGDVVGVTHGQVPLDGHGQRGVDGAWNSKQINVSRY